MDKFKIDSHKLTYHVGRLNDWLKGKDIYPVYMEVSPAGSCNHRCTYCALDFMDYKPVFLNTKIFKERLSEMGSLGVKSIMYAGEGEPFLHKDIAQIINHTKRSAIDVALTTNGVLFSKPIVDKSLGNISWIKVSINGGTEKTYAKIHRGAPGDFNKVISNMEYARRVKQKNGYKCVLGMQIILLPENYREVTTLARVAKDLGMDYLVVKPYSQHPLSRTKRYHNIKYNEYLYLANRLSAFNDERFNVVFRINTMRKWDDQARSYRHCLALPFWSYIDASGNLWGCSVYLSKEAFRYGNIYENTFKSLWKSSKKLRLAEWARNKLNTDKCRVHCRMDEVNRYLWDLTHPPEHVNFI
jgi:GTP 3',8-cyclase